MIDVGQLADDADGAVGHRGRERRQLRREEADVRIERGVGEPQRQLGVHLRRQREPARSRHREALGRRVEVRSSACSPRSDSRPGDLADAFVAGEQIGDVDLARRSAGESNVPVPLAVNCMSPDSGARGNDSEASDSTGILRAVGVERVVAVPRDPGGAGDRARALARCRCCRGGRRCPRSAGSRSRRRTSRRRPCPVDLQASDAIGRLRYFP